MSLEYRRDGNVVLLTFNHPPVNAFGLPLRTALVQAFTQIVNDRTVAAVVVHGAGKGFSAGGDKSEFGKPEATRRPTLSRDVLAAVEGCGKPVIAAVHGFAVGGGLEFVLACGTRIAVADARVGLPEVGIGRFPLSGSQRLPRLIGIERAAQWMLGAQTMAADHPDATGVFDRLVEDESTLLPVAVEAAQQAAMKPPVPIRQRPFPDANPRTALQVAINRYSSGQPLSAAQQSLLAALQAAVDSADFQAGLDRAQVLFDELVG